MRKGIHCYEVGCDRNGIPHYKKIKEILLDFQPQFMSITSGNGNGPYVCIGSTGGFSLYNLGSGGRVFQPTHLLHVQNVQCPLSTLLSNPSLSNPMDALCCVDLGPEYQEFLLCFSKFGIYVTYSGERARQSEIMWTTQALEQIPRENSIQISAKLKVRFLLVM